MKAILLFALLSFCLNQAFSQSVQLDSSFNKSGIVNKPAGVAYAIAVQPDGKILVGGSSAIGFILVRYNASGVIDKTFGVNGTATAFNNGDAQVNAIVVKPSGNIFAGGSSGGNFGIAKFTSTGKLDSSYGKNGTVTTNFFGNDDHIFSLAVQDDNKLVACGTAYDHESDESRFALARYKADGTLDSSFTKDGKWSQHINEQRFEDGKGVVLQQDGKIVAIGDADVTAVRDIALLRLKSNGKLDSSFGKNGFAINDFGGFELCEAATTQSDGKIIVVGISNIGTGNMLIARYTINGKLDSTFGTNGSTIENFNSGGAIANGVTVLKDDRIVVAGYVNGIFSLARLNSNGSPDNSFGNNGYFSISQGTANAVIEQSNGKIVAAGTDGNSVNFFICRLKNSTQNKEVKTDNAIASSINTTSIQIFPNPVKNVLHVAGINMQQSKLSIYNAEGKLVMQTIANNKSKDINIQQLPAGTYYLQINNASSNQTKNTSNLKFIKQ